MIPGASIVFGLIIGSFLNVVVHRVPRGQSIVRPGSRCGGCGAPVRWFDNIPVVSYLALRGKCRRCRAPISVRYPVIELLTALLFVATERKFGWNWLLWVHDWPFVALLIAITFIDLEHRIIPDKLNFLGIALGLATSWAVPGLGLQSSAIGAAGGFALFYSFSWLYFKRTGRVGLGGGDIKFLAFVGAFLGLGGVFTTVLVSSVLGSILGLLYAWLSKEKQVMKVAIPYGPFLVIGALYYYLLGEGLWLPFTIPT